MGTKTLFNVQKYASKNNNNNKIIEQLYQSLHEILPYFPPKKYPTRLDNYFMTLKKKKRKERKMTYSVFVYTL